MSETPKIVCKPTRWFIFRAVVMLLMFGVFAVLFYRDGSTGYRKKNEAYLLHAAFQNAVDAFSVRHNSGSLTPEQWRAFAATQAVALPDDRSILPREMKIPQPWPEILHDYDRMRPMSVNGLWREYTKSRGMDEKIAEKPYDARTIREQWFVFWISSALALLAAFYLIRTLRRAITADNEAITDQRGRRVPYADLRVLDLRKWETKGLAFIDYDGPSGKGRLRIDGLTYGGFKPDDGEPAEKLMRMIKGRFSGEIIEFAKPAAPEDEGKGPADPADSNQKTS